MPWCARDTPPRRGDLAATDPADVRDRLVGGATRPGGHDGGAPAGAAGDARVADGVHGLRQGHLGADRRQTSGQPRCPRAWGAQAQDVRGS
jgi:hypothetical protein